MPHELIYTSVPRGLRPGSTGYCTVARTDGLPDALAGQLEGLSAYRHLRVGADPDESGNPVAHAHTVLTAGRRTYHVLSRVADAGLDHTGRSNYLAHHVALGPDECPAQGPAWACQRWPFETAWDGPPGGLPGGRAAPGGAAGPRPCAGWEREAGDAGWAGVLAAATDPAEPAYLVFRPGQDVLGLVAEALALLPPDDRWRVTFNTFYTKAAASVGCQWRCVPAGSPEAKAADAARRGVVLRLDRRELPGAPAGPLVEAARTGVVPERAPAPPAPRPSPARRPEPLPEPEEDEVEPARPARSRPAPPGGLRQLLVGLALGLVLAAVAAALLEAGTGASPLRHAGVKGRAEGDLDRKLGEVGKELGDAQEQGRKTALELDAAKKGWAGDQARWRDERDGLLRDADGEREARKKAEKKAADAHDALDSKAKGLLKKRDELAADLKKSQAAVRVLEEERDRAKAPPPAVVGVPAELPAKAKDKVLFRVGPVGPDATLQVLGLPRGLTATPAGAKVTVTGKAPKPDEAFEAVLEVKPDGAVTCDARHPERHPLLGLAVIRVSPGEGRPPVYRQLFRPADRDPPPEAATDKDDADPGGLVQRYTFDLAGLTTGGLQKEVGAAAGLGRLALGGSARVRLGGVDYDLEPAASPAAHPPAVAAAGHVYALESRPADGKVSAIRLTVAGGKVIVEASFPQPAAAPKCRLAAVEVVRPLPDLPGARQVLLRVR